MTPGQIRDAHWVRTRPRAVLVLDPEDGPAAAAHFKNIGGIEHGRVLIYPTPGCRSLANFGLDLLAAVGKNPYIDGESRPKLVAAWNEACAWLVDQAPTDLIIDRAHRLPPEVLAAAVIAAAAIDATAWLIWSGDTDTDQVTAVLEEAGHPPAVRRIGELPHELPAVPIHTPPVPETPNPIRPLLPTADFPLFLAHARRQLGDQAFKQLAAVYEEADRRASLWLIETMPEVRIGRFDPALIARWLRDVQIGPQVSAYEAMITLRATQAALARRGVILTWTRTRLGPRPEQHLPGKITLNLASALRTLPRTGDAAATAIALHLEQNAHCFTCWNLSDVEGPTLRPPAAHRHYEPARNSTSVWPHERRYDEMLHLEVPCHHPVTLPRYAEGLLRAHVARRRMDGAQPGDALFTGHSASTLTGSIRRSALYVGHDPWWLDVDRIRLRRNGSGARVVISSWMTERGLMIWPPHHDFAPTREET